jgi:transposase
METRGGTHAVPQPVARPAPATRRDASVRTRLETLISTLNEEIATVEQEIAATLQQDEAWAVAATHLATITGLGTLTIAWILTTTINFTLTTTPEAAANYAGLAPQLRQSGSSVRGRPRVGHGGNARLRRALYMASLSAIQHNPVIKAFYTRLRAAGKPRKVAVCAAARKLLRIAWAVANKRRISIRPMQRVRARRSVEGELVVRGEMCVATARVKTARRKRLRSNQRRAACACPGLDRRGRMGELAPHATRG